jgi:hypothetical protein
VSNPPVLSFPGLGSACATRTVVMGVLSEAGVHLSVFSGLARVTRRTEKPAGCGRRAR